MGSIEEHEEVTIERSISSNWHRTASVKDGGSDPESMNGGSGVKQSRHEFCGYERKPQGDVVSSKLTVLSIQGPPCSNC